MKMNNKLNWLLSLGVLFCTSGLMAQRNTTLKTFSIGARLVHFYDLPSSRYVVTNGDKQGLNGDKTKFDIGFDVYVEKQFTPLIGAQLGFRKGNLTGANDVEYYENSFSEGYLDVLFIFSNLDMFHMDSKWNFYAKAGLGTGTFESQQFLLSDDSPDNAINKGFWEGHTGLGLQYEINSSLRLELDVAYNVAYTDAFDGYNDNYGSDSYLTTGLGLAYTFGKKEKSSMYGVNYFGEEYLNVSGAAPVQTQAPIADTLTDKKIEALQEQLEEQQKELNRSQGHINQQQKELDALKRLNRGGSSAGNSFSVYFDFDSSILSKQAKMKLMEHVQSGAEGSINLTAYADQAGDEAYNKTLKERRAKAVVSFLKELGVAEENININLGETLKLNRTNDFLNRRVEIHF